MGTTVPEPTDHPTTDDNAVDVDNPDFQPDDQMVPAASLKPGDVIAIRGHEAEVRHVEPDGDDILLVFGNGISVDTARCLADHMLFRFDPGTAASVRAGHAERRRRAHAVRGMHQLANYLHDGLPLPEYLQMTVTGGFATVKELEQWRDRIGGDFRQLGNSLYLSPQISETVSVSFYTRAPEPESTQTGDAS